MVTGQSGFPRSDQRWSKHIMVTTAMLTTPIPTSWSPLEWDTVKTRHTSTHDLQAEPKIWTPRLAANWLSGKFMIQLDTGENQVSGWSVSAGCRLAGRNEDRYQDWSMNAAKNHFIQPSICFQNKATNRNNRKGDNDNWPRTSAPNSCQPRWNMGTYGGKHGKSALTEVF